ncbi:MAG: site-specific integrase [Bacilli bacterium]|nr:site-specific integrase [Bacilli bacterium]
MREAEGEKRKTKVVYDIRDAINLKWQYKHEIEKQKQKIKEYKQRENGVISYTLTIRDGIDLYLQDKKKKVERNQAELTTYEDDVIRLKSNLFIGTNILDLRIIDVGKEKANEIVEYLWNAKVTVGSNKGKPYAENSLHSVYKFIHKIFEYFKNDLNLIDVNPFSNVPNKPKLKINQKSYLDKEDIILIKEHLKAENIRFHTLITLIMDTGMRREEALALRYSDINFNTRILSISRALVKSRLTGKYIVKSVKTESSNRNMYLTAYALELVQNYRNFKEKSGMVVLDDDYIFTRWEENEFLDPSHFTSEWKKFIDKLPIENIPLKNLRDSHASFFGSIGAPLKDIQNRMGHSKSETTINIYTHSNLSADKKLVEEYERTFYDWCGLQLYDLYFICTDRFNNKRKLNSFLEEVTDNLITDDNYDIELKRVQDYLFELFPIFETLLKIDNELSDEDIKIILNGYTPVYRGIRIDKLECEIKLKM